MQRSGRDCHLDTNRPRTIVSFQTLPDAKKEDVNIASILTSRGWLCRSIVIQWTIGGKCIRGCILKIELTEAYFINFTYDLLMKKKDADLQYLLIFGAQGTHIPIILL